MSHGLVVTGKTDQEGKIRETPPRQVQVREGGRRGRGRMAQPSLSEEAGLPALTAVPISQAGT